MTRLKLKVARPTIVKAHQLKKDGTLAVVIPKEIREQLGILKGTELLVYVTDEGEVAYRPLKKERSVEKPS